MIITATQFREKQKEYLDQSLKEDIYITRNGRILAKITNPYTDKAKTISSLRGSISTQMSEEEIREERMKGL